MIIDDPEAFKAWLTAVLKPLCEADPGALAKYVFALVKKDKSEDVLRQSMVSQLEVFLQKETENFVSLLFKTLDNKEYLTPVIPNANPPNPNLIKSIESTSPRKKEIIPLSELSSVTETINGSTTTATINTKKEKEIEPPKKERDIKKSDSEKDERSRRRSRHRSSSRNRSRSRSWDRSRKSRSREKSRDRDREIYRTDREKRERARPYRNKSPPRRYDRRRSRTPSPGGKIRSRSRSPRHSYRGRYRNRSPPRSNSRSRSRSRSRSLDRKDRKESARADNKEVKDPHSGAGTPTQDSNHGDMDMRLTNTTQSIQSVVVHQSSSDSRSQKKRCRDFDEKGYCMRGEMCQYDHGTDPVVLEDSALSSVLTYTSNNAPVADVAPIIAPPILGTNSHPMMHPVHPRPLPPEYNPQAPQMWHRPGFRGPRPMLGPRVTPMGAFVPQQRELIPVPVLDNQAPDQFGNAYKRQMQYGGNGGTGGMGTNMGQDNESHHDAVFKKKTFDYNRLGPRAKNSANCSLELKKVPPGLNNITHLNNHFSKFGKIVNIQVCYEGDPEAAIVTFSSHAEANAAYRSTEAVLNNRFIKVFWHTNTSNDGKQENVPPRSVKDRLGLPSTVPPNSNKVLNLVQPKASENGNGDDSQSVNALVDKSQQNNNNNTNSFTKNNVVVKKEENKAQIAAAIIKNQELLAAKEKLKKNQEEKRKEALKLTQDLRKRKQELLEKQLTQQKLLIDKMEKTPPGPARDLLKQTIKKSQESIEAIRKDMLSQSPTVSKIPAARKSKEEVQKEVLDAELDLIAKQQEGVDTSELQKKLLELKAKVALENKTRSSRGRRFNPVNRYLLTKNNMVDNSGLKGNVKSPATRSTFQKHAVDHRPTRILVSGYEGDEQESLLTFFSQFGEIVDYVSDTATPSLVINYKIRKEAEIAMLKGKHFQDRTLSVTWCTSAQLNSQLSGRSSTRTVLLSESEEDQLIEQSLDNENESEQIGIELSEEVLLQDDEEEEEDNEGRSWRR